MILEGYVTDKSRKPVANAVVEIKGENFDTLFAQKAMITVITDLIYLRENIRF